jgi:hypothetical protein
MTTTPTPAVQLTINRMRAVLALTMQVLDRLADQTGSNPALAAAFNAICEETGITARVAEALQSSEPAKAQRTLTCAGGWKCCDGLVSMIGSKGYAYCGPCGIERRQSGAERVRKLTPAELRTLQAGEALRAY